VTRRAVFLDRDGTLNVRAGDHEYVASAHDFTWLPGAAAGVARLAQAGYVIAVVSNQQGVARGDVTPEAIRAIEERIHHDLASHGCEITTFRYCTHSEEDGCDCRKPKPGMIVALARELDLDVTSSWMIGDSESDVRAGQAAGCRTVLIGDSHGSTLADLNARSLAEASDLLTPAGRTAGVRRIQRGSAPASASKRSTSAW
jgi:D-glycero-D-manno-heptose 1,7-bisphosphate phosphatase